MGSLYRKIYCRAKNGVFRIKSKNFRGKNMVTSPDSGFGHAWNASHGAIEEWL